MHNLGWVHDQGLEAYQALGCLYLDATGPERNPEEGTRSLRHAATPGHQPSKARLRQRGVATER